eukprot:Em0011g299a
MNCLFCRAKVLWSVNAMDFKALPIRSLISTVIAACTGPIAGIRQLQMDIDEPDRMQDAPLAGIANWNKRLLQLDGESMSLYHHIANSSTRYGDPIADVYALVARPNNAILVVADGCNWGPRPRQAARCAVHGCVSDLNSKLFESSPSTIIDIFQIMLSSLNGAQRLIVQNEGTTTTLCMAVVCEMTKSHDWGLCVDKTGDMRDSGGCLGANVGTNPDLSNLLCCFTHLSEGDIVFLTSDGISDNFDPVIMQQVSDPLQEYEMGKGAAVLESVSAKRRQEMLLENLSGLLRQADSNSDNGLNAFLLKEAVISHVIDLTDAKRQYMEAQEKEIEREGLTASEKRKLIKEMQKTTTMYPGKLDHATVAAYQVGHLAI